MKPEIGTMWKFFSLCSHVLIMTVHVQISVALFLNECPEKLMWTLRAKQLCGVEDKYMCLYDTNERSFRELCKESPEFHRPGNVFVISGNLQYFAGRPCYANRYQPHKWWTNGSSDCQYLKSSCNGEGQVPYDNGTIASDRKCRCDYTNYYTFVNSTRNKCHCDPIEDDCSCYRKRCNEDQVLTPDYDCVGVHQWTGRYVCPEYKQPKINDDNKMQQITICPDIEKDLSGTVHQLHARIAVTLTSGVLMILGLMTTIAFLINRNTRQDVDEVRNEVQELKDIYKLSGKEEHSGLGLEKLKMETEQVEVIPKNIRDQIVKEIKYWKEKDIMFVSTRASKYVMEQLQNNSCLTLTGPSGVGKSFIARHTALLLQNEEYTVIPVRKPDDIRDYYQPGKKTVFIIDNICGNFEANQQQIENWKQSLPVIDKIISDKSCKIIVCSRLQVYKDYKFNILVPFKLCECNLMSDKLCLTSEEKNSMARIYTDSSLDNIDNFSQNSEFFPLLCYLYDNKKHGDVKEFFRNPFSIYQNELDSLSMYGVEGKYKICSLALLVLFNNQLTDKWFKGKVTERQRYIIEDTCEACRLNRGTSKAELKDALLTLVGTFIYKQNGMYRTLHDKLFDFLAHYFGQKMIECLIDHGDSNLVHERLTLRKSLTEKNSNIDFIIEIPDEYLELYLERFIKDWSAGKVTVALSNNNMKVPLFRQHLLQLLNQLDKPDQLKLANTNDKVLPRENSGSGTTPLVCTCYDGYTDMVHWLLHNDVDVDQCRDDGVSGLIMASQEGHTEIVKVLLERNPDVNLCDKDGKSPLLRASQNGHTDIVKLLLERNPDVNLCDKDGFSSLLRASQNGHTDIVKLLLEMNPDVNLCNNDCQSPLLKASYNGHTEIVKLLLERNADVNLCDKDGFCPLYMASQNGLTDIVKLLLERNADLNLCDKDGHSPLLQASYNGHTEIVKLLLERDADVNLCDKDYQSPLYMAGQNGLTDIVKLLLERNADLNLCDKDGKSPLLQASQNGHTKIVKMLLERNSGVNLCDKDGFSPLYMASQNGLTDIVKLLLERNYDVNLCDKDGKSPLLQASQNGHTEVVKLLLERNADVNLCDKDGFSPLYMASQNGLTDIVKLLLERNYDFNLCDKDGKSPLLQASQNGHTEVVKLLLERNADVNLCDKDGFSPLYMASQNGHTEIVMLLLERNRDVNLCDKDGKSPLLQASQNGHTEIVMLLQARNSYVNLCDKDGKSPLLQASQNGHTDIVMLLLARNSDVNLCDKDGKSPLLQASQNGHTYIVKMLLERNSDVNLCDKDGFSSLYMASQNGLTDIVKLLLERSSGVNLCDKDGKSPLLQASQNGHTEVVKLLLERNADVNLCDKDGFSPLYMASQNGLTDIVKLLLKRNPDVNLCDKDGKSPLLQASYNGHTEIVKLLLERDADVNLCDKDYQSPLYMAGQNELTEIVKLLLEKDADVNLCDKDGLNPLKNK